MAFIFRKQPLKTFYLLCALPTLLFIKFPFYALLYMFPSARPLRTWTFKRSMMVLLYRAIISLFYTTSPPIPPLLERSRKNWDLYHVANVNPVPSELVVGYVREAASLNDVASASIYGYWYGEIGTQISRGRKARLGEKVVYHFVGGSFVTGTAHPSGPVKTLIDGLLKHLFDNVSVFALEYRQSSTFPFKRTNPFPAALLDALAGYRYLVLEAGLQPQNIIISGDSAGGTVAIWLTRYLAMSRIPGLPSPGGLLLMSPTADWANTRMGPTSSMQRNAPTDFVYPILASRYTLRALLGTIPESEAAVNEWIAPCSALLEHTPGFFSGFPNTFILSGGREQTLDAMVTLAERLRKDIGEDNVTYSEYPDATHDFLTASWHEPERTEALQEIGRWVEKCIWKDVSGR